MKAKKILLLYGMAMLLATNAVAVTNIVYSINATPPQVYKTGQRLMLNVVFDTAPDARGFAHLRFISQDPKSVASPAISMLLNANGAFDMVPVGRAPVVSLHNLSAGGIASRHNVAVQVYLAANSTTFRGGYAATWPHPLETADITGNIEVVFCGEGMTLASLDVRWTTNPTLFILK